MHEESSIYYRFESLYVFIEGKWQLHIEVFIICKIKLPQTSALFSKTTSSKQIATKSEVTNSKQIPCYEEQMFIYERDNLPVHFRRFIALKYFTTNVRG